MQGYLKHIIGLLVLSLLASCTKVITLDLPLPEEQVVVEGRIQNGQPPLVLLTKNSPYFGGFDLNDLASYYVHDAAITIVERGGDTVNLVEYCVADFPESVQREAARLLGYNLSDSTEVPNVCMYSTPSALQFFLTGDTTGFTGRVGGHYDLTINVQGQTLTSTTYIPGLLPIELSWRPHPDPTQDSLVAVWLTYDDPDTTGNFVRYFTQRNDESFYPPVTSSVYDDLLIPPGEVLTLPTERGQPPRSGRGRDDFGYFMYGDTVTIMFCSLDKEHYDFWHTIENDNGDSPFSSPINIKSNINGGLGVWGGYGAYYATIIIPE